MNLDRLKENRNRLILIVILIIDIILTTAFIINKTEHNKKLLNEIDIKNNKIEVLEFDLKKSKENLTDALTKGSVYIDEMEKVTTENNELKFKLEKSNKRIDDLKKELNEMNKE